MVQPNGISNNSSKSEVIKRGTTQTSQTTSPSSNTPKSGGVRINMPLFMRGSADLLRSSETFPYLSLDNSTINTVYVKESSDYADKWKSEFSDYVPTSQVKYDRIYKRIHDYKELTNKEDAKYIANMVCELSDRYGIDPEITANILLYESHLQFIPEVMENPDSTFKGVMQVGKQTIQTMYADPSEATNMKLSRKRRAIAYDNRHFSADQNRIKELKKRYPTIDDLYTAMQKDVSLGVEIGIMAYKAKLSCAKGRTVAAMSMYCGSQYKLPSDSLSPRAKEPIPIRYENIPVYRGEQ